MKINYLIALSLLIFSSCGEDPQQSDYDISDQDQKTLHQEGKTLMENKCYVCHNPNLKENQLIAPPMIAIKEAYMTENEEDFTKLFIDFLSSPDEDKAKLPDAVEKYGLMPYQRYDNESLKKIASYMYNNTIEKPSWWNGETETSENQEAKDFGDNYKEKGLHFAMTTKQVLGQNLMGTIQREGVLEALEFCNVQAYPLTDSMANYHNAKITRISDQPRNPNNKADEEGLKYIQQFKDELEAEKDESSIVIETDEQVVFYHPIITNDKCLLCHGDPKSNIDEQVFNTVNELYPEDKAVGYYANQVRGAWKIVFDK